MKIAGIILRVLAVVLAIATFATFFFPFVNVSLSGKEANLNGWECAMGGDLSALGAGYESFKGLYFLAALLLILATAAAMVTALFSKKKGWNGTALVTGVLAVILMMIVYFASPISSYVDMGTLTSLAGKGIAKLAYTNFMMFAAIGSVATVVVNAAGILVYDAAVCKQTGDLTILQKVFKFLREYKSELKKVVWPGPRSVVKNTLVVLGFCAIALIIIALADFGLMKLFEFCFK